jgi:hypothetical protein
MVVCLKVPSRGNGGSSSLIKLGTIFGVTSKQAFVFVGVEKENWQADIDANGTSLSWVFSIHRSTTKIGSS